MVLRFLSKVYFFYFALLFAVIFMFMPGNVSAANGEPESMLPPSGVKGVVGAQTGGQVYTSPASNAFLYVPSTSGPTSVTVQEISNQYGNGKLISFTVGYMNTNGNCSAAIGAGTIQNGVNGFSNNQVYNIPAVSSFSNIQKIPNGKGIEYAVFCVSVSTSSLLGFGPCTIIGSDGRRYSTCYWDVTFRLTTSSLNLLGVYPGAGGNDNATTSALRKGTGYFASTGLVWGEEISFATPCEINSGTEPITFYDMDIPYSQRDLFIQLQERERDTNNAYVNVPLKTAYPGQLGLRNSPSNGSPTPLQNQGSGATSYVLPSTGSYSVSKEYKLILSNIGRNNKIRIRIPFSQINSVVKCVDPAPRPTCTITSVAIVGGYKLTWTSKDATSASIDNGIGSNVLLPAGEKEVGENAAKYTMSVSGPGGTATCETTTRQVSTPECTIAQKSIGVGEEFKLSVLVENKDSTNEVSITGAKYTANSNVISPQTGNSVAPALPAKVTAGDSITLDSGTVTASANGKYSYYWTVNLSSGATTWTLECKDAGGDGVPNIIVSETPYTRVYGGDVYAGGGLIDSVGGCTNNTASALGYMKGTGDDSYAGTGVELAVFAVSNISGVQTFANSGSNPRSLAFANSGTGVENVGDYNFGGGFDLSGACTNNYFNSTAGATPLLGDDLTTLESGRYIVGSGVGSLTTLVSSGIANGKRIVIYVNGDAYLGNGTDSRFGYANSSGWLGEVGIPSIYIIASGNIYIDKEITQLDGVYVAQPRIDTLPNTTGEISTCSSINGSSVVDYSNLGSVASIAQEVVANCNKKLTINGAFTAKRVHLLRHVASLNVATPKEARGSANISEEFIYSPDLFMTQGGGVPSLRRNFKVDSLVTLPPVY